VPVTIGSLDDRGHSALIFLNQVEQYLNFQGFRTNTGQYWFWHVACFVK
jgi:hypothetical protein